MVDRVVLGSSSLGHTVIQALLDRQGSLKVVTADESRAESLLESGVDVTVGDPSDDSTLEGLAGVEMLFVADDDPETNLAITRTARRVFEDALLVAYAGAGNTDSVETLAGMADRVVDPSEATSAFLLDRVGDSGIQVRRLVETLRSIDRLAIVTHDNPDPDAIGSAVALSRLAAEAGCEPEICYFGEITHQENRAFVNLLAFDLQNLDDDDDLEEFDGVALVDHSRPGVNDQLPETTDVDVVIDHHPPRSPVDARFVDLRSDVGATSTLLVDYLDSLAIGFDEDVATGLLFGIRVDTQEFTREASQADFEAAATLLPHADVGTLERIEAPSISPDTFDTLADAIGNRQQDNGVIVSCVGQLSDRDALAQAADRLLTMESVSTTLVCGVRDGTIYVSARSNSETMDLGDVLRDAFGSIGSAGGHADMAGAQITLGVLESVDDHEESLTDIVEEVVTDRFFEALEAHTDRAVVSTRARAEDVEQYLIPEEYVPIGDDS